MSLFSRQQSRLPQRQHLIETQPERYLSTRLQSFGEAVRAYDQIKSRQEQLMSEREMLELGISPASLDEIEFDISTPALDEIDFELPVEQHPAEVAVRALGYYILGRKIEDLKEHMYQLEPMSLEYYSEQGRILVRGCRLEVVALEPERRKVARYAHREALGKKDFDGGLKTSRRGKLVEVNLSLEKGGHIDLQSRMGLIQRAEPLIDRDNDYQPLFSIRPL